MPTISMFYGILVAMYVLDTDKHHLIFKMPWQGDPRINIQDASGKAKPYQVRQVLQAIDKLEENK